MSKTNTIALGSWFGDISKSIKNILLTSGSYNVVGFDSKAIADPNLEEVVPSPECSSAEFIPWLQEYLMKNKISEYVPCSEYEMRALRISQFKMKGGNLVWVGPIIFKMFDDKLSGSINAQKYGLEVPRLFLPEGGNYKVQYPCVVKPRFSSGSKNIFICRNDLDFCEAITQTPQPLVQEYIDYEDNEYTIGVFRNPKQGVRHIALRRILQNGYTKWAQVESIGSLGRQICQFANKLNLIGSVNIQARKQKDKYYVFEVNPRFSSTVQGRHLLEFKDFMWSINNYEIPTQEFLDKNIGKIISRNEDGLFQIL